MIYRLVAGLAAVFLTAAVAPASAQAPGRTVSPAVKMAPVEQIDIKKFKATPPPANVDLKAATPKDRVLTMKLMPIVYLPAITFTGDMKGWTAITNGATAGGASVVPIGADQAKIFVRGKDNVVYTATVNPGAPAPVDSASWSASNITANSEPRCNKSFGSASSDYTCVYLGPGGSARIAFIGVSGGGGSYEDLGGQNAGFAPTLVGDTQHYYGTNPDTKQTGLIEQFDLMTWDGGIGSFRLTRLTFQPMGMGGYGPVQQIVKSAPTGWVKMKGAHPTPYSCVDQICVIGDTVNNLRLVDAATTMADFDAIPKGLGSSTAVPDGLSLKSAPGLVRLGSGRMVAVVRAKSGKIYQSVIGNDRKFSAWKDEGGFAPDGTQISCVARKEQPVCYIQGGDGKIYAKALSTPGGL